VRFAPRRTTKGVTRHLIPVPSVALFCRASWKNARQRLFTVRCQTWRTAKGLYRAKCYRAPWRKSHGKEIAVRFRAFAVRSAKPLFPVVSLHQAVDTKHLVNSMLNKRCHYCS
jgi:hypothetical protein